MRGSYNVLIFSVAVYAASALSGLPSRPSYSFGRGRAAARTPTAEQGAPIEASSAASAPQNPGGSTDDREQLYGAYNALHSLAQDFKKPFDSPAVLVVGHQTSGKSALLEALMGFQFNQVNKHNMSSSCISIDLIL